jgi:glycosyltransferase involved in cell wall biosynthesis
MPAKTVIFVSYDGLTDALGQSQILPYVIGLSQKGHAMHIVSFEKAKALHAAETVHAQCKRYGITWHAQRYHKWPPVASTLFDLVLMYRRVKCLQAQYGASLVHARGYIAALAALRLKRRKGIAFIFDMRGFWADEKRDAGAWPLNHFVYEPVYRFFKRQEQAFMHESCAAISLTHAGKADVLQRMPHIAPDHIQVIPCSVDTHLFNPEALPAATLLTLRQQLQIPQTAPVISYLGSVGTWYMIPELMRLMALYVQLHTDAHILFICPNAHEYIKAQARLQGIAHRLHVVAAQRAQVPAYLALSQVSAFFIRPSYSKLSSSPTKQGEIMALGIPCICNSGVGDTAALVQQYHSGAVLTSFNDAEYLKAIKALANVAPAHTIRQGALQAFDLQMAIENYNRIYQLPN